jgi:hypothetical protein
LGRIGNLGQLVAIGSHSTLLNTRGFLRLENHMNQQYKDATLYAQTIPYCLTREEKRRRVKALLAMLLTAIRG